MGKRKLTVTQAHGHPKHVQEQCDVWLTAKVPPKQPVLRRLPLSVIQQIYPGPTVDVSTATKQTTLLDFFKKPRESKREDSLHYAQQAEENRKPENGCSRNRLNEDQVGYFDTLQEGERNEEPPMKQMRKSKHPEPTIVRLFDTSAAHQQDENRMLGSQTMIYSNLKCNSISRNIYRQQSATNNGSDKPTSRSRKTKPSNIVTHPQSYHGSQRKSDYLERQKCKGTDKGNDSSVDDDPPDGDSFHLSLSSGLSQSTDSQSCGVTVVALKGVKNVTSSLGNIETEEVLYPTRQNLSRSCERYKTFNRGNDSCQGKRNPVSPAAKSKKLQYIHPYLLDSETSHTQLTDVLGASNVLDDTYLNGSTLNGRVLRVNLVDSELMLNSCSIGESTEESQWSRPDLSVDDPTLSLNSPSESLVGPSLADVDPLSEENSYLFVDDPTLSLDSPFESLVGPSLAADGFALSVEDPALCVNQPLIEYPCLSIIDSPSSVPRCGPSHSPADFSEFTLNTQGCFVPKEPAHGTSLFQEDSQCYD
ncbi:uncharacterized protein LOC117298444 [Asterias rubens]|uniref:uncharacterized protein LOC117298444 n=1 Tax=Asterias rubens TaxID=7604 RepID=UPI00145584B2|nr:uncharacterized protein LOC117298444 [Asterias rubens]